MTNDQGGFSARFNEEIERRCLYVLLHEPNRSFGIAHDLLKEDGSDFRGAGHQEIYAAAFKLWDSHKLNDRLDSAVFLDELRQRGEIRKINHILVEVTTTTADPLCINEYCHVVVRDARLREAALDASSLTGAVMAGDLDKVADIAAKFATKSAEAAQGVGSATPDWASAFTLGGGFVLDVPALPPAVWGEGDQIAWADGEALMLCGPPGVGKTTLVQQLVEARLGISKEVLGMPVQPGNGRVLYLAMDRPPQIARAMARLFGDHNRLVLDERLIVWKGPPPADLARHTDLLAEMCEQARADTVIVDSLKDAVLKLSDDESGSGYNRARQLALVGGVQVVELHHQRKASGENKKPNKIDDVYGSTWLTSGAGSVFVLWGQPGDPLVELLHLKQPMEPVGPLQMLHNHTTGRSSVQHQADLLALVRCQGHAGLTPQMAAKALYTSEKPTKNEIEKARRALDKKVADGYLSCQPGIRGGGSAAYFLIADEKVRALR